MLLQKVLPRSSWSELHIPNDLVYLRYRSMSGHSVASYAIFWNTNMLLQIV